jgi:predicted peptidase
MKPVLLLLFIGVMIAACENPDEILPVPPAPRDSTSVVVTVTSPEKKPPLSTGSELYQYGKFDDMPYRILLPRSYDPTKTYPLFVFLHGIGERGIDNEQPLSMGSSLFQVDSIREKYPAFIIFPQCPETSYWFDKDVTKKLRGLIDTSVAMYPIDKDKISIGGFSMGAYGTFALVSQNPGLFAAAVAISGDGDVNEASRMAKTKWRIFAGKKDAVVPSSKTEKMAKALQVAGATVSFTLYPEADHGRSRANAFSEKDFCSWLFSASRNR